MRKKQGLKGFQLAERLQVSAARVSVLEKDEMRGAVTLKMMAKAAKAMGCRFEYQIVPLADKAVAEERKLAASEKPRVRVVVK
jgi:transcriptional regulator with XRE-family HTH domain